MTARLLIRRLLGCSLATLALTASGAQAATVTTNHGCYPVGQKVTLTGNGFAAARAYVVSVDDVYYGESGTSATGAFSVTFGPGGLGANVAQSIDNLIATDGTTTAATTFTVTRPTGARFLAKKGNPATLHAPFELWDFSSTGAHQAVYLHYVAPTGALRQTVALGRTTGECGYLKTRSMRVFPFKPTFGYWHLQVDTQRAYSAHPSGPVARILVGIA
jgi:hypothetical protein